MSSRRSARNQVLPERERLALAELKGYSLYRYMFELYSIGWTLRAIGEALQPPKSRSTVQTWVDRGREVAPDPKLPPVSAPTLATPPVYIPIKPPSPGIPGGDLETIQRLAPIARKFRSGMSPLHKASQANQDLTDLCLSLYDKNVTIKELADAAGVTYRAMSKRLGKADK